MLSIEQPKINLVQLMQHLNHALPKKTPNHDWMLKALAKLNTYALLTILLCFGLKDT